MRLATAHQTHLLVGPFPEPPNSAMCTSATLNLLWFQNIPPDAKILIHVNGAFTRTFGFALDNILNSIKTQGWQFLLSLVSRNIPEVVNAFSSKLLNDLTQTQEVLQVTTEKGQALTVAVQGTIEELEHNGRFLTVNFIVLPGLQHLSLSQ